jgi:hypothetical protein
MIQSFGINKLGVNKLGIGSSSGYWTPAIKALFDSFWIGGVSGNNLTDASGNGNDIAIIGKDFTGSYIPVGSSATFKMPDVAGLKTDDADNLWFDGGGSQIAVSNTVLLATDFTRTLIYYDSIGNIKAIGLLKAASVVSDLLYEKFKLYMFWSGVLNLEGYTKYNRSPNPPFGEELITFGDFASVGDWKQLAGSEHISVTGGKAVFDGTVSACLYKSTLPIHVFGRVYQLENGKTYRLKYTISGSSGGSVYFSQHTGVHLFTEYDTAKVRANGSYTETLTCISNQNSFAIWGGNGGSWSLDDISLKEIL